MSYDFIFAGSALSSFSGVTIERPPCEIAEYDFELLDIPGRSGSEFIDNKRYKNALMTRNIGLIKRPLSASDTIVEDLIEWLAYRQGYQVFKDSDHPGLQTNAVLTNFNEVQTILRRYHKANLKFSRVPFWYKTDSLSEQHYSYSEAKAGIQMTNPYPIDSEPVIRVRLTTVQVVSHVDFDVEINDTKITVDGIYRPASENSSVVIDSEKQIAYILYHDTNETKTLDIDVPRDFCLSPGNNTVKVTRRLATATDVYITPKWRRL